MQLITGENYNPIYPLILKQVIYGIKNKLLGKAIRSPIFVIFYGNAGTGKSTFVRSFCSVVPEHKYAFVKAGDKVINSESHTSMLHDNLVIHIDEMSGLAKADIGKLKTLDAPYISYRPLYTNSTHRAFNSATLIGCSNTAVKNILINTEDNRKWVQVNFYNNGNEDMRQERIRAIESFDYKSLWKSVNENGIEPLSDPSTYTDYKNYVREVCASTTPTTDYIDLVIEKWGGRWINKNELYNDYKGNVDTETHRMGKDKFFELCEKRGFDFKRKPGVGTFGYQIPGQLFNPQQ